MSEYNGLPTCKSPVFTVQKIFISLHSGHSFPVYCVVSLNTDPFFGSPLEQDEFLFRAEVRIRGHGILH